MLYRLKNDKYRKARGGYARFLNIYCAACGQHALLYQKDGPGILKRLYADRIIAPESLSDGQKIACASCGVLLGTRYVYEKERRPAFLVQAGAVSKKLGKGVYPPIVGKLDI